MRSERRAAFRALASMLVALSCGIGVESRADVLPSNVRPCEGASPGAPCKTDRCNPGACGTLPGTSCAASDLAACVLCNKADAGSCEAACERKTAPCFLCVPTDLAKEIADSREPSRVDRYSDCSARKPGDTCRTEACDEGRCVEGNGAGDDSSLRCVVLEPPAHGKSVAILAIVALVVGGVTAGLARRRGPKGTSSEP